MIKAEMFDKDGRRINAQVMPDGGKLRTHMTIMDAAGPDIAAITRAAVADAERPQAAMHRPGSLALTDADRDAREMARDDRKAKLSDAWKAPAAVNAAKIEKPSPTSDADARYAQRIAKLEGRWRN